MVRFDKNQELQLRVKGIEGIQFVVGYDAMMDGGYRDEYAAYVKAIKENGEEFEVRYTHYGTALERRYRKELKGLEVVRIFNEVIRGAVVYMLNPAPMRCEEALAEIELDCWDADKFYHFLGAILPDYSEGELLEFYAELETILN